MNREATLRVHFLRTDSDDIIICIDIYDVSNDLVRWGI